MLISFWKLINPSKGECRLNYAKRIDSDLTENTLISFAKKNWLMLFREINVTFTCVHGVISEMI